MAEYTCNEYRAEMVLLGMRRRLAHGHDLSDEEKEKLRTEIKRLETELDL